MKDNQLKKLEEIKEKEKLPKQEKDKISNMILNNSIHAICIFVIILALIIMPKVMKTNIAINIYRITSIFMLIFSFTLFEKAYKNKNKKLKIEGIEILVLAIIILFAPYSFIKKPNKVLKLSGVYYVIYYFIKSCIMYYNEKKEYLKQISDISEIVKKESKDKLKEKAELKEKNKKNKETKKKTEKTKKKVSQNKKTNVQNKEQKDTPKRGKVKTRKGQEIK